MRPLVTFALAIALVWNSDAQNLADIGKKYPLSITGGTTLNQIIYTAAGIQSRRDPYAIYATGNVNLSLYEWNIPFSFHVSNQQTQFSQPFNQYSLHPRYKSITGHFGYTSATYSPYTVNGHIFLGGAIDVEPEGKWKLNALYGRFLKAGEPDTLQQAMPPAFQRMGYAVKGGYYNEQNFVELTLFHAADKLQSISALPDSLGLFAEENLAASISAGKKILKHFLLRAEFATSALSHDVRAPETNLEHPLANVNFLYKSRTSSAFHNAFKTSFDFQHEYLVLGVAFERIDPGYKTLGAYYFNNDLQNITMNASTSLWQGRMSLACSGGVQKDNLDGAKMSSMNRMVASINANYVPTEKVNIAVSYSNFQTFTNIRSQFQQINQLSPYENLDTLNFTQLTQNASVNFMYALGSNENRKQNLSFNLSVQDAADKQGEVIQNSGVKFYNANTIYVVNIIPLNLSFSASMNMTVTESAALDTRTYGPVLSVTRSFFDKTLRTTLSSSYNQTLNNDLRLAQVLNGRLAGNVTIKKKHNINFSAVVVKRVTNSENANKEYVEFTGMVGYAYNFAIRKENEKQKK